MVSRKDPGSYAMTIRFDRSLADRAKVVAALEHRTLTGTLIAALEEHVTRVEAARKIIPPVTLNDDEKGIVSLLSRAR